MCEPTTIALGASAVIGLAGAAYSASETSKAGKFNQQVAENNAALARDQAQVAQAMGDRESQQQTWRTRALLGQQRAAIASSGVDAGVGTPLDILGESALFGEVDQQTIRLNTARQAWGFNAQAADIQNQGRLGRGAARAQATGTILSGLSGAGSTASRINW